MARQSVVVGNDAAHKFKSPKKYAIDLAAVVTVLAIEELHDTNTLPLIQNPGNAKDSPVIACRSEHVHFKLWNLRSTNFTVVVSGQTKAEFRVTEGDAW